MPEESDRSALEAGAFDEACSPSDGVIQPASRTAAATATAATKAKIATKKRAGLRRDDS